MEIPNVNGIIYKYIFNSYSGSSLIWGILSKIIAELIKEIQS